MIPETDVAGGSSPRRSRLGQCGLSARGVAREVEDEMRIEELAMKGGAAREPGADAVSPIASLRAIPTRCPEVAYR